MPNMVVFGATSAIAQATLREFCDGRHAFFLVGRNATHLEHVAADLRARGSSTVHTFTADLDETAGHAGIYDAMTGVFPTVDVIFIAYGTLPDQQSCVSSHASALKALQTNALSVMSLLTLGAAVMERQGNGTIACISSVAGDRGRQSNYVYGAAKAALSTYLQGLRNRLYRRGVHVLTIKPGFVDTPMTAAFPKGVLWATPERVARDIAAGIRRRRDVVYTPWFWQWIMLVIRHIPERLFKRLSL